MKYEVLYEVSLLKTRASVTDIDYSDLNSSCALSVLIFHYKTLWCDFLIVPLRSVTIMFLQYFAV